MTANDNNALSEDQVATIQTLTELVIELRGYPRYERHQKIRAVATRFHKEMEDAGLSVYRSGVEGLVQWLIVATTDPENRD